MPTDASRRVHCAAAFLCTRPRRHKRITSMGPSAALRWVERACSITDGSLVHQSDVVASSMVMVLATASRSVGL